MILPLIGLAAVVIAWLFFRRPGVPMFGFFEKRPLNPAEQFTAFGFMLWLGGVLAFVFGLMLAHAW